MYSAPLSYNIVLRRYVADQLPSIPQLIEYLRFQGLTDVALPSCIMAAIFWIVAYHDRQWSDAFGVGGKSR